MHPIARALVCACIAVLTNLLATGPSLAQDLPGAKDHALLKRFAGSTIVGYDYKRFDTFTVPTGTFVNYDTTLKKPVWASTIPAEGAVTTLWYEAAGDASAIELVRNYRNEIVGSGGTVLYDSSQDAAFRKRSCLLCLFSWVDVKTNRSNYVFSAADTNTAQIASFRVPRAQGDAYAVVYAVQWAAGDRSYKSVKGAYVAVNVIEPQPMQQNMVTVSANDMSKAIAATGRIALYGILFDTAKAELKAESKPALDEIAKLLKAEPALRLRVVGHTDNQGTLDANIALSKRRAEAVTAALGSAYGIAPARLGAFGVADLAPVASNAAEEGRAKNRRVELVPQ